MMNEIIKMLHNFSFKMGSKIKIKQILQSKYVKYFFLW